MPFATTKNHFFTCGAAEGITPRNSRDAALLIARIGNVNVVRVGSVVPPGSAFIEPRELSPGDLVPAVCAAITSEMPGEIISAGVAVAYPAEPGIPGMIMDYSAPGHKADIEAIVRRMAEEALRTRNLAVGEIRSLSVQHRVEKIGSAVAAVVLC